jgi:ABC-type transporter Mla subunit MlaD
MAEADRNLERASAAVDSVIHSLVEMRPGALRRAPARLSDVVETLTAILQRAVAPGDKRAIEPAAQALRGRIDSAMALLASAQRFCGAPAAADDFTGYTAEGETERFHTSGTLLFEL